LPRWRGWIAIKEIVANKNITEKPRTSIGGYISEESGGNASTTTPVVPDRRQFAGRSLRIMIITGEK
jgi:hypothetical protein